MYPTSKDTDYETAQKELDAAIDAKKVEAERLEESLRRMPTTRRKAGALRGIWFGSFAAGGFMTFLIGGAYWGVYVEPLRQFWYWWPSVGVAADATKLGLIWAACLALAAAARILRKRGLNRALTALDQGLAEL